jgi:hypothetical protein
MSNYKNVGDFYGKQQDIRTFKEDNDWVLPSTMMGLEIELEGFSKYPKFNGPQYWEQKEDGSLRNIREKIPIEFVFASPLCGYDLTRAISLFDETIASLKEKPYASPRTSTHVHLDVREISFNQLLNLIIMYTVVERPLYKYCGIQREESNFCLPFYKAEGLVFEQLYATDIIGNAEQLVSVTTGQNRYNGLNVCALKKFGTLEFRQFPGTFNTVLIRRWINIIMCLKKAAVEYSGNLFKLPAVFSEAGIKTQVEKIFGNYFPYLDYPEMEYDVLLGIRLAQDILYRNDKYDASTQIEQIMGKEPQVESVYSTTIKKNLKLPKTRSKKAKESAYNPPEQPAHLFNFNVQAINAAADVAVANIQNNVWIQQHNAQAAAPIEIQEIEEFNLNNYNYTRMFTLDRPPQTGRSFNNDFRLEIAHIGNTIRIGESNCKVITVLNLGNDTTIKYVVDSANNVYSIGPQ